ncbi:MAG: HIT family protein, partial [Acidimicrobiales bacterium]|nr:HIT family protein [Acidimicrobiales bacterium]
MATIFTRIINGEIPGRFIWSDDVCIGMLDIRPLHRGHVLVIPRQEVDQWTDLPVAVAAHLMTVAHHIGNAQSDVIQPARVGLMIAGFEVPHTHVHVVPIDGMGDLDFRNADTSPKADQLDAVAEELRAALRSAGHAENVP